MNASHRGQVIKAYNHWFDVWLEDARQVWACQPRGRLRLEGRGILVGDRVRVLPRADGEGWIESVEPRRTELTRPPVANVDRVVAVMAWRRPDFVPELLDRILVQAEHAALEILVVFNKIDLVEDEEDRARLHAVRERYRRAGYPVFLTDALHGEGVDRLRPHLERGVTVLAGPSGAGKSKLLSAIEPGLRLRSEAVSEKTGRGRHTTRHPELLRLGEGWVADTPGFSRLDLSGLASDGLGDLFPEFAPHTAACRFNDCKHRAEPGCAVRAAVEAGQVDAERYARYLQFLAEVEALEEARY
ncbi:MAG: ribosome small subunit-dependent GTPase A [Firmicutes bacterium]|nr:ribosome small subunit-dependent GTPase A [Bacillota bacterium]